jgi:hypothetical protein
VKQHLGRQSGVQSVEVSLIDGKVQITPKEDGRIDSPQLLKAVYDSGVSVAEMDVIARGKVVKDGSGALALDMAPNQSFGIEPNEVSRELQSLAGQPTPITVRGQLYKKPAGRKKQKPDASALLKLLILEVQKKE